MLATSDEPLERAIAARTADPTSFGSVTLKPSPTEPGKFVPDDRKSLDFSLNNQEDVANRSWRIKLEAAEKLSEYVIKEATDQLEKELHESPVLGGGLAWDHKARFQHAYAQVMRQNPSMDTQEAADLAILQTPTARRATRRAMTSR